MMNLILEAENVFKNGTQLDLFSKLPKLTQWRMKNHFYFMLVNAKKKKKERKACELAHTASEFH